MRFSRALLMMAVWTALAVPAWPEDASSDPAVESGRQALDGPTHFPWYDASRDGLRRLDVEPPRDLDNRESKWQMDTKPKLSLPEWLWTLLEVLGWTLLTVVIALVVWALIRTFLQDAAGGLADTDQQRRPTAGDADRVESLPFQLRRPQSDLLAEARLCYDAGEYGQAMIYLYSYQLLQLDKHQLIRLARGKTNRQYLREMRTKPGLRALLERAMVAFEDVFFGRHHLERRRFEACWTRLDEFHQLLEQAAP